MNRPKKLVSHVVARISQDQSISNTWISIDAIRNSKPNKFLVKVSSNGTEYLVFINDEEKTSKNDTENNPHCTFNLYSFNKNLPYFQCIDWQRFQLLCKHTVAVCSESIL